MERAGRGYTGVSWENDGISVRELQDVRIRYIWAITGCGEQLCFIVVR